MVSLFFKNCIVMTSNGVNGPRYGKEDLELFRIVVLERLDKAQKSFLDLLQSLGAGSNEAVSSVKDSKESSLNIASQSLASFAERQRFLIIALEKAIERINDGTYGICKLTGSLISRERLLKVPHTEYSIEAKIPIQPSFTKTVNNKRISNSKKSVAVS